MIIRADTEFKKHQEIFQPPPTEDVGYSALAD